MLPLYKATAIEKAPLVGGSTQPCLLLATAYNGKPVGSYVVKIFKQRNLEQINGTAKEVYANVLAQHFDLAVPSAALIEVEQWLINALKKLPEFETYLQRKDWAFLITNPKGGHHLFFKDLCHFNKKEAITFDQFGDNLRTLKPEILLRKEAEQLEEYGISTTDYYPIEKYLKAAVQNAPLFLENLKFLLA